MAGKVTVALCELRGVRQLQAARKLRSCIESAFTNSAKERSLRSKTSESRTNRAPCGPLKLVLPEGTLDLGLLKGGVAISEDDVRRSLRIECSAARVLTIENDTTFTELVKRAGAPCSFRPVIQAVSCLPCSSACPRVSNAGISATTLLEASTSCAI
jgi:hypothetical protein